MQQKIIIPTELGEITVRNYMQFMKRIENATEARTMQLAMQYFCFLEEDAIYSMDANDIIEASSIIYETLQKKPKQLVGDESVVIGGVEYAFVADKDWSFGEFIDLQGLYSTDGHFPIDEFVKIVWREKDSKGNIQPYTAREEFIDDFPLDLALGSFNFFLTALESIVVEFPELFGEKGDDDDNESIYGLSTEAIFSKKWGWLGKIDTLAQGDVTKWDAVTNTDFRVCLTKMIFDDEKQALIDRKLKQQQAAMQG